MRRPVSRTRGAAWRALASAAAAASVVAMAGAASGGAAASPAGRTAGAAPAAGGTIAPAAANDLDCNGWSRTYRPARPAMKSLCVDPVGSVGGHPSRFSDNGWYVGHDEPTVKFISAQPGSGNTMTYGMRLPVDPARAATASGSVTKYGELSVAPWFGLPICDPRSYPQNPCAPDSDANSGSIADPAAAGSAFMELQFYPPGFTPFLDSTSCSPTTWCAALTIDSLECSFNFATCNNNCVEPVNFAFLQTNGVPAGPAAPQDPTLATFMGNRQTLRMRAGDVLRVSITDPPGGLTASVRDLTTGRTGYMQASAANGFANTDPATCQGSPFTFHAEYSTASQANQVPWAALEGGVLMEQEIGHFESCERITHQSGLSETLAAGSYSDPRVFQTCDGGSEGVATTGEGPCAFQLVSVFCANATTQGPSGPAACPTADAASGALCEFADGFCFPRGGREVTLNGRPAWATSALNGCTDNAYQNGDLDFDGIPYQADWPDGSSGHPTSIAYTGPVSRGHAYPSVQFETDVAGSEALCSVITGAGCAAPPAGAAFYPFWSLARAGTSRLTGRAGCVWNFGDVIPGSTTRDFGGDAQYGTPDLARYGGTLTSAVLRNPQLGRC